MADAQRETDRSCPKTAAAGNDVEPRSRLLQINESQSIWQWPATEIEAQIKMNELPPKPIYDSLPQGAKIQIVSLRDGNERLSGNF